MGFYPSVPAPRIAYDIDGSTGFSYWSGNATTTPLTSGQLQTLNNFSSDAVRVGSTGSNTFTRVGINFPELMTISGYCVIGQRSNTGIGALTWGLASYSTNSTDGLNGDWPSFSVSGIESSSVSPTYRTSVITLAQPVMAKSIRFRAAQTYIFGATYPVDWRMLHLYGRPVSSSSIEFLHPTTNLSLPGSYFDFEDIARGTTSVIPFKIKNSNLVAANSITLSLNFINSGITQNPSLSTQYTLSLDNQAYSSTITISSLAANQISNILYIKRTTSETATLGLHGGRITATVESWGS